MKHLTTITSILVLIVMGVLLTISFIQFDASHSISHVDRVDCFGAGCGPVDHIVMHDYFVTDMVYTGNYIEFSHDRFPEQRRKVASPEILPESPPPKLSLV